MKIKELKKLIEKFDDDLQVVIDFDLNGYYVLERVQPARANNDEIIFVNLISSNES